MVNHNLSTSSPYPRNNQYINRSDSCSSAFNCGAEYTMLDTKVSEISKRVEILEQQNEARNEYYKQATKLINVQRYILVILPIVSLVIISIVGYYFTKHAVAAYSVVTFLGLSTVINGYILPKNIESIEKRIDKIENAMEKR